MIVRFKKGSHLPSWITTIRVMLIALFGGSVRVTFTPESRYYLDGGDQLDWNKIIGRGGLRTKNGIREQETFLVWRYSNKKDCFEITEYWREDYKMHWNPPTEVGYYQTVEVCLDFLKGLLPLGSYFGGNRPAPRNVKFKLKKA